jgi:hypothetical protein
MVYLDSFAAEDIAEDLVIDLIDDQGYSPEEAIPGLIQAVLNIAGKSRDPEGLLDAAANYLADGGVRGE